MILCVNDTPIPSHGNNFAVSKAGTVTEIIAKSTKRCKYSSLKGYVWCRNSRSMCFQCNKNINDMKATVFASSGDKSTGSFLTQRSGSQEMQPVF